MGQKLANPWGLYDMHGNVAEWCMDSWDATANYPGGSVVDPLVAAGTYRVVRGGVWLYFADYARSAARSSFEPEDASFLTGFRTVLAPVQTTE